MTAGDAEFQYLLYPGDGPPLVLLHATGLLPWLWHPIARALSPKYRIIAPYFCDHRSSEPDQGGLSWLLLAEDLKSLCETLSLGQPYLAGHSMGATVITIAHAFLGLPAEKIVLIEPILLPQNIYTMKLTVGQHPLASRSIKRRSTWKNAEEARGYLRSKKLFDRWDDEMRELYIRYGMVAGDDGGLTLACQPRDEASLFMGGAQFDPWPILSAIRCPAMVVEGETSENRSVIDLPTIAAKIPRGSYRMVRGAGHLIPQEQPGTVTKILEEFFRP